MESGEESSLEKLTELIAAHPSAVSEADEVVVHTPTSCQSCNADLSVAAVIESEYHQVVDLMQIRTFVTEHVSESRRCANGHDTSAGFPPIATEHTSYGPGIRALVAYLTIYQKLPLDKTTQILSDLLGIDMSAKGVAQLVTEAQRFGKPGPQGA